MSNVRQSGFCLAMTAILACCVMVAILPRASVGADLPPPWKVHNKLLGKPKDAAGLESKKSEDVSGIACAASGFPRLCLIVDDETQGAQIVIVNDGDLIAATSFVSSRMFMKASPSNSTRKGRHTTMSTNLSMSSVRMGGHAMKTTRRTRPRTRPKQKRADVSSAFASRLTPSI